MTSPGEPALCQLCRHTFVPYVTGQRRSGLHEVESVVCHLCDCGPVAPGSLNFNRRSSSLLAVVDIAAGHKSRDRQPTRVSEPRLVNRQRSRLTEQ